VLVILAVCHRDTAQARALLSWIGELDGTLPQHEFTLITSSLVPQDDQVALQDLARRVFPQTTHLHQTTPDERNNVTAATALFRIALLDWVERHRQVPFLWLEPDCVPICSGWIDQIEAAYRAGGKAFMGCVYPYPNSHMNGCGVYPSNARMFNRFLIADSQRTFDNDHPELTLRHTLDTPLIRRMLADTATATPMSFPDAANLSVIPNGCVLFHGCKDGTLIERLRERRVGSNVQLPIRRPDPIRSTIRALLDVVQRKPSIPELTVVCVDTLNPARARRAIDKTLEEITPGAVLFFTNDDHQKDAIKIPYINGTHAYSWFLLGKVVDHVKTTHMLVVHWDGYVLDGDSWKPEFLCDYIGAPWLKTNEPGHPFGPQHTVGNGGFSIRSTKLMRLVRSFGSPFHPEDGIICRTHRARLESQGCRFATTELAREFSVEYGVYGQGVKRGQFGFHSFNTVLPPDVERPWVFNHSGDWGDAIYGLAAIKALGRGVFYYTDQPLKMPPRQKANRQTFNNLAPLLRVQDYIWKADVFYEMPIATDYDLNAFRNPYHPNVNLARQQCDVCRVEFDETAPWLTVDFPMVIPQRPICVSRSARYHDREFPWRTLLEQWHQQMFFVGTYEEWVNLIDHFGFWIPKVETGHLLDVARVIAGAKVFVGNQSCPLAIAHGLGKPVVQECFCRCDEHPGSGDDNCHFDREKTLYSNRDKITTIPKEWIR